METKPRATVKTAGSAGHVGCISRGVSTEVHVSESPTIVLPRGLVIGLAKLFAVLFLAGSVTVLVAPLMGLPAIGWAWVSLSDWDGINAREGMMFLMLLLPILAPLPIAFAGFWRVLYMAGPPTVALAGQPAPVRQIGETLQTLRIREDSLRNTRARLQGQLDAVSMQLDSLRAQREVEAELLAAS